MNITTFNKRFFVHRLKLKIELMDGIFNTISVDTGITEERISQLINEIKAEPTVTEFYNICNWFNLPMSMFFGSNAIVVHTGGVTENAKFNDELFHDYIKKRSDLTVIELPKEKDDEPFIFIGANHRPLAAPIPKYDITTPWQSKTPLHVTNTEMKIPFTANPMHVIQSQKPLNRKERRAAKKK